MRRLRWISDEQMTVNRGLRPMSMGCERDRPRGSGGAVAGLLHGPADAGRAQERRADGGGDGAGAGGGPASVAAAFRRRRRRGRTRRCWRRCARWCCRRSSGTGRSRRGSSTTPAFPRRAALGRRGAAILRPARQAGQLPGRGHRCRSPISTRACRWPIGCICRRSGRQDRRRRRKAGVPEDVGFKTKPEIALEQIRCGLRGRPAARRGADGRRLWQQHAICARRSRRSGLSYVAGILSNTTVWAPGTGPLPPKPWSGRGRPPKLMRRDAEHRPVSVKELALGLPKQRLAHDHLARRHGRARCPRALPACGFVPRIATTIAAEPAGRMAADRMARGREGAGQILALHPSRRHRLRTALVDLAKLRWRIERDYQELKQELGLGHYEGRGWRGFHHHATLCIAAYGFLIAERETIPPSGPRPAKLFPEPAVPDGYRPRGSAAAARTPCPELDRDHAPTTDRRARQKPPAMSVLQRSDPNTVAAKNL